MKAVVFFRRLLPGVFAAALLISCEQPAEQGTAQTLRLVEQWVHGSYDNLAQVDADLAADLPPEKMHRPMYQLFAPTEVPALDGHIVFQQSSMDGSEDPQQIFRHGLVQFFADAESGTVRQREYTFKEPETYKNAHRNPEVLQTVTLTDLDWDAGCDFFMQSTADGSMVHGPLVEGACALSMPGRSEKMFADDLVEITATEYRFRGRYVDAAGNVVWGTESDELNTLVRQ